MDLDATLIKLEPWSEEEWIWEKPE